MFIIHLLYPEAPENELIIPLLYSRAPENKLIIPRSAIVGNVHHSSPVFESLRK